MLVQGDPFFVGQIKIEAKLNFCSNVAPRRLKRPPSAEGGKQIVYDTFFLLVTLAYVGEKAQRVDLREIINSHLEAMLLQTQDVAV